MTERTFDFRELVDELACHTTEWLERRRSDLVREQRRLHVEELAVTRVLDDRGRASAGDIGVSARAERETLETARRLEALPEVAAAAHAGALSRDQLVAVIGVADEASDAEWAR